MLIERLFMSRDYRLYISDIFIAINKIQRYTDDFISADSLRWSEMAWDATIRELEIIGEATRALIEDDILENKKYRKIVDFRNIIAHAYFGLDEDEVFIVIKEKLSPFEDELIDLITEKDIPIQEVLLLTIEENKKVAPLTDYLKKLYKRFDNAR